jgi:hypothetical protein
VSGLAIGAAVVVAMTLLASLTLLPALLGFAGERVEITRWRGLIIAALAAVALVGAGLGMPALLLVTVPLAVVVVLAGSAVAPLRRRVRQRKPLQNTFSYRWSRLVQHHPWWAVSVGASVLVVLALPVFGLRLGFSDDGNFPEGTTTRQAYDLPAEGFGPGFNGPLTLATELPDGVGGSALQKVPDAIAADDGVALVTPPVTNDPFAPTAALWRVVPTTAPQDEATTDPGRSPARRNPSCRDRRHRPRCGRDRRRCRRHRLHQLSVLAAAVLLRGRTGAVVPAADDLFRSVLVVFGGEVGDAVDGWTADRGVHAVMVVAVEPAGKRACAVGFAVVGPDVGPFVEQGPVEALDAPMFVKGQFGAGGRVGMSGWRRGGC